MADPSVVLAASKGVLEKVGLAEFLGKPVRRVNRLFASEQPVAVLAWGRKPSAIKAVKRAERMELPVWYLEDGFIHSMSQGVLGQASCSLVVDYSGIYYDATASSDLEFLLEHDPEEQLEDTALLQRAQHLMQKIRTHTVSKYNNGALTADTLNLPEGEHILVVDQTEADRSLLYGLVEAESADQMLTAALTEHPDAQVLLSIHPDVLAGYKQGCISLAKRLEDEPRLHVIADPINPLVLLERCAHVYTLTSQMGFEALLAGKSVSCFGMPFYAGWGLTDDRVNKTHEVFTRRTRTRSLEQVFAAAYLVYSRYIHPDTQKRCEAEEVVDYIAQQHHYYRENTGRWFAFGFTRWKQNYVRRFLHSPASSIEFVWSQQQAVKQGFDQDCRLLVWGERARREARALSESTGVPLWCMEDGFIRSAGLGSDYTAPLSLVLDKQGIYYNPLTTSDLEDLLENSVFDAPLLERAQHLRKQLLWAQLSKYNLGVNLSRSQIPASAEQRIILVPGQVEDDASIRKGCPDIRTNEALLQAVRQACPDDYIIYKPHPDVVSGNRQGEVSRALLEASCNLVLEDVSITACLQWVDEVHTLTSLVGFEALLRHRKVVCYGSPFYAGWGLTEDRQVISRRQRSLSLDELCAAALILYPRYINWQTGAFTTPEQALELLHKQLIQQGGKKKTKTLRLYRFYQQALHVISGVFTFRR